MGKVSRMLRTCIPSHKTKCDAEQRDIPTARKVSVAMMGEITNPSRHEDAQAPVDSKSAKPKSWWARKLLANIKTGRRNTELSNLEERRENLEGAVTVLEEQISLSSLGYQVGHQVDDAVTAGATLVAVNTTINSESDATEHQLPEPVISTISKRNDEAALIDTTEVEHINNTSPPSDPSTAPSPSSDHTLVDEAEVTETPSSHISHFESHHHPGYKLPDQSILSEIEPIHSFDVRAFESGSPQATSPITSDNERSNRIDSGHNSDEDKSSDIWQDLAVEVEPKTASDLLNDLKKRAHDLATERASFEKEKDALKAEKQAFEAEYVAFQEATKKLMANIEAAVENNDNREAALEKAENEMKEKAAGLTEERLDKQEAAITAERQEFEDQHQELTHERRELLALAKSMVKEDASESVPATDASNELGAINEEDEPEERSQEEINAILRGMSKVIAAPERERSNDLTTRRRAAEANQRDADSDFKEQPNRARKVRWAESNHTKLFFKTSIIMKTDKDDESSGELADNESSSDMSSSEEDEDIWERMVVSGF